MVWVDFKMFPTVCKTVIWLFYVPKPCPHTPLPSSTSCFPSLISNTIKPTKMEYFAPLHCISTTSNAFSFFLFFLVDNQHKLWHWSIWDKRQDVVEQKKKKINQIKKWNKRSKWVLMQSSSSSSSSSSLHPLWNSSFNRVKPTVGATAQHSQSGVTRWIVSLEETWTLKATEPPRLLSRCLIFIQELLFQQLPRS